MKENLIRTKSFDFALRIVKLSRYLNETQKEYIMSKQILRSGTAIGANIREALNAESKLDFIHKLSIAQKETDETLYWLELLNAAAIIENHAFLSIYADGESILKILRSIIISTKSQLKQPVKSAP